jgi:UDP:flavonoid glycosyltransferase YjiC (YdhE family)
MQISIIAPGSRGDVQPYIALGRGLIEKCHSVRILSNHNHENLVTSNGVDFWPIEVSSEDIVRSDRVRAALESGGSVKSLLQMRDEMKNHAALLGIRGLECCSDADMIIGGISGFSGIAFAEKLNIPFFPAFNIPITPTKELPGALFPKYPRIFRRLSHFLTRQLLWMAHRPSDNIIRQDVLDLQPLPRTGPYKSEKMNENPTIYAFSPSVIPKPADWADDIHVTGYWFLDSEEDLTPSNELQDFLNWGEAPVYIGFGSMGDRDSMQLSNLVLGALEDSGQRGIIHTGWGGLSDVEVPESVLVVDAAPHGWLFSRVGAVVHHGGAGTTAAGLRGGVPSIIVPFHGDQPFWGQLISKIGVGPKPVPHNGLTRESLATAIIEATSNDQMQSTATRLGERIRGEDGVTDAVEIIHQYV